MNLGQVIGELQLQIYELEQQLAATRGRRNTSERAIDGTQAEGRGATEAAPIMSPGSPVSEREEIPSSPGTRASIWASIRTVLQAYSDPMSIDEIAVVIPDVSRTRIAKNVSVRVTQGYLIRHGARQAARYSLSLRT